MQYMYDNYCNNCMSIQKIIFLKSTFLTFEIIENCTRSDSNCYYSNKHDSVHVKMIWLLTITGRGVAPPGRRMSRHCSWRDLAQEKGVRSGSARQEQGDCLQCPLIGGWGWGKVFCDWSSLLWFCNMKNWDQTRPKTIWLWPIKENLVNFREKSWS